MNYLEHCRKWTGYNHIRYSISFCIKLSKVEQNKEEKPIQELVPLANSLRNEVGVLHRLIATLNEIRHRVEL